MGLMDTEKARSIRIFVIPHPGCNRSDIRRIYKFSCLHVVQWVTLFCAWDNHITFMSPWQSEQFVAIISSRSKVIKKKIFGCFWLVWFSLEDFLWNYFFTPLHHEQLNPAVARLFRHVARKTIMTTTKAPTGQRHEYVKSKTNFITVIVYILFLHIYILLKPHTEAHSPRLGLSYMRFHIILGRSGPIPS